jgi:hypothetical protein
MKKIFSKNISLLIAYLLFIGGSIFLFLFLARERKKFSLQDTLSENNLMLASLFFISTVSLTFSLVSVYKNFSDSTRATTFIKVLVLHVPLLLLQCSLLLGWIVLTARY